METPPTVDEVSQLVARLQETYAGRITAYLLWRRPRKNAP
jgi:hypothetical protein